MSPRNYIRKSNTGEPGGRGEFGTHKREESGVTLANLPMPAVGETIEYGGESGTITHVDDRTAVFKSDAGDMQLISGRDLGLDDQTVLVDEAELQEVVDGISAKLGQEPQRLTYAEQQKMQADLRSEQAARADMFGGSGFPAGGFVMDDELGARITKMVEDDLASAAPVDVKQQIADIQADVRPGIRKAVEDKLIARDLAEAALAAGPVVKEKPDYVDLPETLRRRRGHVFYPKAEMRKWPALYSGEDGKIGDAKIMAHYFVGGSDWYITEVDPKSGIAFGFAKLGGYERGEWGNISLPELEALYPNPFTIVERDCHYSDAGKPAREVLPSYAWAFGDREDD